MPALLATCVWASYLTSMYLDFLKMEVLLPTQNLCEDQMGILFCFTNDVDSVSGTCLSSLPKITHLINLMVPVITAAV